MDSITINLSLCGLIVSAVMMLVAIANMNRGKKDRDETRLRENVEMRFKLDNISDGMSDIKKDIQTSLNAMQENDKRITALETSVSGLICRVNKIEKKESEHD